MNKKITMKVKKSLRTEIEKYFKKNPEKTVSSLSRESGITRQWIYHVLADKKRFVKKVTLMKLIDVIDPGLITSDLAIEPRKDNVYGENLRYYRKDREMSLKELAEASEWCVTPGSISQVERGLNRPYKLAITLKLCKALGLTGEQTKEMTNWSNKYHKKHTRNPIIDIFL